MLYYKVVNNKYLHKDKEWILMLHGIGGNLNIKANRCTVRKL